VRLTSPHARPVLVVVAAALAVAVAVGLAGCGAAFIPVRPSEPVTATVGTLRAEVARLWLTDDVRDRGLDDDVDLVVELDVRNDGADARRVAPGSCSLLMELDARRPGETRALPSGGGGEGEFLGDEPDDGSLLAPVTIPPRQSRRVWALFHGYRFDGSDRPRRITLRAPFDAGVLVLDLADPARGDERWETPAATHGVALGLKSLSLVGGGLRASAPATEVTFTGRRGRLAWDLGLVSSILVEQRGPLVSSTSAFSTSGLTGHLMWPALTWGGAQDPRQLGVFVGGSSSFALELPASSTPSGTKPHAYGLYTAEGGLELTFGAAHLAPSPFPLTPANAPLPRWSFRVGYAQAWSDGVTAGGYLTALRFIF